MRIDCLTWCKCLVKFQVSDDITKCRRGQIFNEADPSKAVLTIKSLEAFEKAADGKATKIIIPSEIQGVAGLAKAVVESVKETE